MKLETKLKHAPAPWHVDHQVRSTNVGTQFIQVVDKDDVEVSDIYLYKDTAQANARLIAAAPELLDALSALVAVMHATYDKLDEYVASGDHVNRNPLANKQVQDIADMATDALTKAVGENQE